MSISRPSIPGPRSCHGPAAAAVGCCAPCHCATTSSSPPSSVPSRARTDRHCAPPTHRQPHRIACELSREPAPSQRETARDSKIGMRNAPGLVGVSELIREPA
eukprot:1756422-Rhodomonas_salina.2